MGGRRRVMRRTCAVMALLVPILAFIAIHQASSAQAVAAPAVPGLNVYVGYAHGSINPPTGGLPDPWQGSPGVTFLGGSAECCLDNGTLGWDDGALLLENPTGSPVTVESATITIGGRLYDLWGANNVVPAGQGLILTSNHLYDLDTSDFLYGDPCTTDLTVPVVHLKIAGVAVDLPDTGLVLTVGGRDYFHCTPGDPTPTEYHPWTLISAPAGPSTSPPPTTTTTSPGAVAGECTAGANCEAETASFGSGMSSHACACSGGQAVGGFTQPGDYLSWRVWVPSAGSYDLTIGYAAGAGAAQRFLNVNGVVVNSALAFGSTGNWSSWATVKTTATLRAGHNDILLTNRQWSSLDLDYLLVSAAGSPPPTTTTVPATTTTVAPTTTTVPSTTTVAPPTTTTSAPPATTTTVPPSPTGGPHPVDSTVVGSPQYLTLASQKFAGAGVGCVDLAWAAGSGLIQPVEVRWLNELGLNCPDATGSREDFPSDQYVVMTALAARHSLTCADVEWNAGAGYLTHTGLVNLDGLLGGCAHSRYALMVPLEVSGLLTCNDVVWNLSEGFISTLQASWLQAPLACGLPLG